MATDNPTRKRTSKRFTTPFVDSVKAPTEKPQADYFDSVLPGFGLRVGKRRKSYFIMVRTLRDGKWTMTRTTLGTTDEMALSEARESAREAITRARQGKAPIEVKRERREAQNFQSRNTFANVRAEFLRLYRTRQNKKPSPRTLEELKRVLESGLFDDWSDTPLVAITKKDVMDVTDGLMDAGKEAAANRYLTYIKMLFKWAKRRDIIKVDPAIDIGKPGSENSRERVLELGEMRAIWHATEPTQANKGDLHAAIVRVLMLTGQRRSEVSGMRWSEIQGDMWSLPASFVENGKVVKRTKNGLPHLVPLSDPVRAIVEARRAEQAATRMTTRFVFTSTGKTPFAGWSKSKERLNRSAHVASWTLHDLRRTLVTRMAEDLRIAPHVIEAVINHASGTKAGVAGIYNRALYLDERKQALDAWAIYVLRVVGEADAGNVEGFQAKTA